MSDSALWIGPEEPPPAPPMPSDEYFARVAKILAPVYAANGWTWNGDDPHVPVESEIELMLRRLAQSVAGGSEWSASGRLIARLFAFRSDGSDAEIRLGLEIVDGR